MKKIIDTRKKLFENMAKLNPDFKPKAEILTEGDDKWIQKAVNPEHKGYCTPMTKPTCTPKRKALAKRFKKGIEDEAYGTPDPLGTNMAKQVNEISTGLAQKASDTATNKYFSSDNEPITARKRDLQSHKFNQYINPELKKFIYAQLLTDTNFTIGREGTALMLKFLINNPQEFPQVDNVTIHIRPDDYDITKGVVDQFGRIHNEKGSAELLPQDILSKLPNVIKRIQADLRGEKSNFNPAKPEPVQQSIPEPVPAPQPEPVQQPAKPMGILDKLRSKFGKNA